MWSHATQWIKLARTHRTFVNIWTGLYILMHTAQLFLGIGLMGGVDGAQAGAAGRLSAVWGGRVPDYKI